MKLFIIGVVSCLMVPIVFAGLSIEDMQAQIEKNGYSWTAVDNPVSRLPDDVKAGMLGTWLPVGHPYVEPKDPGLGDDRFPDSFDLRGLGGTNAAKTPGSCGRGWGLGLGGAFIVPPGVDEEEQIASAVRRCWAEMQGVNS